ncbi:tRNA (adenosine(37)-N6)-threonylcarbamoyltransferase complex ATPase subunit type 1 TsaE [Flaviramulus sp. BrNp1-15]|uniref:tRNA (adenosine(37)-N6)-threonylcarbamoyltransferase complex ATPase subunit type 1 TsaE n=1 Tax=Flaviramulus sp. BrNp1-15 TaxID=2916754 RepID=UPI001EE97638|nr:tRNA (adenosine(37)-N6)-threonylcarbamoyltransferase complex ATPase subunit type 1 TsaE [Flaviramulus sp. BrNp1-15]ULC58253.1 tRNA (adenosine(37)-N6)-threonylcarbamoyltransferase complex ATPase subunit type 1 TsaE [Flaviramulus sp. BrNp1-15]
MKISYELNEIDKVVNQLIGNVKTKTLLFYGEMGVGKTTLIKTIVKQLGSEDEVSSPTFSIVNEYKLDDGKIYHFDLYRIKDLEEAYNFGIEDYLDSENWKLIEWPEKVKPILFDDFDTINLELDLINNKRVLKLS